MTTSDEQLPSSSLRSMLLADSELRALMLEKCRRKIRRHLTAWAEHALSPLGQAPARHHRLLIDELERVERGEVDRLMVFMPPGSAKSTYASILFPAWWFCRHPRSAVIAASHTAALAEWFGRRVRNTIAEHAATIGFRLAADNTAASRWGTNAGGEYYSAGVGGSITGRRADLAIIDDPVKSRAAAESETQRERAWDWFRADLLTRLKPGGRVVLIVKSWHGKQARAFTRGFPNAKPVGTSSNVQQYVFVRPNLTEDQAQQLANQLYAEIITHERTINVTLPGDSILTPRVLVQLTGTGTGYDQTYYPNTVRRTVGRGGYLMYLSAKNHSPQTEMAAP